MGTITISREKIEKETSIQEVAALMPGFLLDREVEFVQLQEAATNGDYSKIRSFAHDWKGFCLPYGFAGLGELSEQLEKAIDDHNLELMTSTISQIANYLKIKREVLSLN